MSETHRKKNMLLSLWIPLVSGAIALTPIFVMVGLVEHGVAGYYKRLSVIDGVKRERLSDPERSFYVPPLLERPKEQP